MTLLLPYFLPPRVRRREWPLLTFGGARRIGFLLLNTNGWSFPAIVVAAAGLSLIIVYMIAPIGGPLP